MFLKCVIGSLVISLALKSVCSEDITQNEIIDSNYSGNQYGNRHEIDIISGNGQMNNDGYGQPQPPTKTWIESARNALSGPAGQMVVHMAKEMISRSTGNSQVNKRKHKQTKYSFRF